MYGGNLSGFNAEDVKPQDSFDPIPAGWYESAITGSEMKPTKDGKGKYLQIEFTVLSGEHEGRKVWDRLNLVNDNQTAVEIAQRALSAICRAVNVMTPNDSTELHDRPLEIKVSVRPPKGEYEAGNDVKGYRPVGSAGTAAQAPAAPGPRAVQGAPATAAKASPPWKKSA